MSTGSTAIITGAAGGIGTVLSLAAAREGRDVVLVDIELTEQLQQLAVQCEALGVRAVALAVDIGDPEAVAALFDQCGHSMKRDGALLINNAAVQTWKPLIDLTPDEWERVIRTNLTGTFLMTQQFAKQLIAADTTGAIVNIGSGCNHLAFPSLVDYSASKGGVEMLTRSASLELGKYGIRVNCVAPGAIETDRTSDETADYASSWSPLTPLGRIGTPEDVAKAVLFLGSEGAAFISGQTLGVDGGLFSRAIWPQNY